MAVHLSSCILYWVCHVDVVSSGSVGFLTQPPSHITALFITPPLAWAPRPACIWKPQPKAHSPNSEQWQEAPTTPISSALSSRPSSELLLLLGSAAAAVYSTPPGSSRPPHALDYHTHMGMLRCTHTHTCTHMYIYFLSFFPGHLL